MTKRLYYHDSYLREFNGTVLECRSLGEQYALVLDQTAFYPESGGQPCDKGTLGDVEVHRVVEDSSGIILHLVDKRVPQGPIQGKIDWGRRFDHMQQHTGQHILSQAFLVTANAQTLSFHLGLETSTIDISLDRASGELMEAAQWLATEIVFQNRPVHIFTASGEDLSLLSVRKATKRGGEIRIVEVKDFDRSACGGTHVRNTGEIGLIFIAGYERYKGGTRVSFVAGERAMNLLQRDHKLLGQLARIYCTAPEKLVDVSEKLLSERTILTRENESLRNQILEREAEDLLSCKQNIEGCRVICKVFSKREMENVKRLAQKLTERPMVVAVLGMEDTCQIVFARSRELPLDCGAAVRKTVAELGGKGGGRPEMAQVGGFATDRFHLWMEALAKYADPRT